MTNKTQITIKVNDDLLEELRKKAKEDDRSLSSYINTLLKKSVK